MSQTFKEIPFGPAPDYGVIINSRLGVSLSRAIDLYRESRQNALTSIYRQKDALNIRDVETEADLEEVSASCGHFSFSLLEFSEQLGELLAILDELQLESEERPNGRSWSWLKFWRRQTESNDPLSSGRWTVDRDGNVTDWIRTIIGRLICRDRRSVECKWR